MSSTGWTCWTRETGWSRRAVFSWSYQQLAPEAARLFRLCGLHPPGHDSDGYALAALLGSDLRTTRRLLDSLARAHLVDQTEAGRYQLHDLLRAYAAERGHATDTEQDRAAALTRLFDHYLQTAARAMDLFAQHEVECQPEPRCVAAPAFAGYQSALRWLDNERANLMHIAQRAHLHHGAIHRAVAISRRRRAPRRRAAAAHCGARGGTRPA